MNPTSRQIVAAAWGQAAQPHNAIGVSRDLDHFLGGTHRLHPDDPMKVMEQVCRDTEAAAIDGTLPHHPDALRRWVNKSYAAALDNRIAVVRKRNNPQDSP